MSFILLSKFKAMVEYDWMDHFLKKNCISIITIQAKINNWPENRLG
jgi:hypothetical protein